MKKFLLTIAIAATTLVSMAQTTNYTGNLVVAINDFPMPAQEETIIVENNNGTYTLRLNNLILNDGEGTIMPVGNIVLNNLTATEENGIKTIDAEQTTIITPGDDSKLPADSYWMEFEEGVPVKLNAKFTDSNLECKIDIDLEIMWVSVTFNGENTTDIKNIVVESKPKNIFDLTGRRIETITTPGIYIVDGKKVIIK